MHLLMHPTFRGPAEVPRYPKREHDTYNIIFCVNMSNTLVSARLWPIGRQLYQQEEFNLN